MCFAIGDKKHNFKDVTRLDTGKRMEKFIRFPIQVIELGYGDG